MASIIKARTISSVVDNRIQLNNSNCARPWSTGLGTNWTKIRVGARIQMTISGTPGSTSRFAFGIQSGSNLWLSAGGPTNWLGVCSDGTWAAHTGAGISAYYLFGSIKLAKKIGTSLTFGGANGDFGIIWDATQVYRSCIFLDITKGSPNYTMSLYMYNVANGGIVGPDVTVETYLANVILGTPAVSRHAYIISTTFAADETAGAFDSVGFAWDQTAQLIELSDVTVVRLA